MSHAEDEPDFRTDRVARKIDSLIPELQSLLDDLRAEVEARNTAQGGVHSSEDPEDHAR